MHVVRSVLGVGVECDGPEDQVEHAHDADEEDDAEGVEPLGVTHVVVVVAHPLLTGLIGIGPWLRQRRQGSLLGIALLVVLLGTGTVKADTKLSWRKMVLVLRTCMEGEGAR